RYKILKKKKKKKKKHKVKKKKKKKKKKVKERKKKKKVMIMTINKISREIILFFKKEKRTKKVASVVETILYLFFPLFHINPFFSCSLSLSLFLLKSKRQT
ncbi:hypothetical protein BJ944DRAFT_235824, partial [Cunninghamella echinulata]